MRWARAAAGLAVRGSARSGGARPRCAASAEESLAHGSGALLALEAVVGLALLPLVAALVGGRATAGSRLLLLAAAGSRSMAQRAAASAGGRLGAVHGSLSCSASLPPRSPERRCVELRRRAAARAGRLLARDRRCLHRLDRARPDPALRPAGDGLLRLPAEPRARVTATGRSARTCSRTAGSRSRRRRSARCSPCASHTTGCAGCSALERPYRAAWARRCAPGRIDRRVVARGDA